MKTVFAIAIALIVVAGGVAAPAPARADSEGERLDERAAVKHAESVVAGTFTGRTSPRSRALKNQIDEHGRAYTATIQLTAYEFTVAERLDGAATPAIIELNAPGALTLPAAGQRVVIGVSADGASPADGYNLLYGRTLDARSDERLAALRDWVQSVRAPEPVPAEAIADRLGQLAAETAPAEASPAGPPAADDPNGPAPVRFDGPPRDGARIVAPQGDPVHPPEPGQAAAAEAAAHWRGLSGSPGASARSALPTTPAMAAAGAAPTRRWPYLAALAAALVVAAVALRSRRRASGPVASGAREVRRHGPRGP